MALESLLAALGHEITDPDEETFLLFAQTIPSQDLGFVDRDARTLTVAVGGKEYVISQSPSVLTSDRARGTTGAVVWKVTPLFAAWLAAPTNALRRTGVLTARSHLLELGCGVSGLIGLVLAPCVARYVLTDQAYVSRLVESNVAENRPTSSTRQKGRQGARRRVKVSLSEGPARDPNLVFTPLDWETDEVGPGLTGSEEVRSFDAVMACDCIYNDALILPLVQTCVDLCRLRTKAREGEGEEEDGFGHGQEKTCCVVTQQLRDPDIFEGWLRHFHRHFRVWRVPEAELSAEVRTNPGFVIHIGILRD